MDCRYAIVALGIVFFSLIGWILMQFNFPVR